MVSLHPCLFLIRNVYELNLNTEKIVLDTSSLKSMRAVISVWLNSTNDFRRSYVAPLSDDFFFFVVKVTCVEE